MDAIKLYQKHAIEKVEGLPRAPLSNTDRKAITKDIANIEVVARAKDYDCSASEARYDKRMAEDHFELTCWLKWFMTSQARRDCVATRALIVFLIFENGLQGLAYEFHTITDFGERQFDDIFEKNDGGDVIVQLNRLVSAFGGERSKVGLAYYGWEREPEPALF